MRKLLLSLAAFMLASASLWAQRTTDKVNWSYSAKKIDAKTYELHLHASIADGHHIFAQEQPEGAIGTPTKFTFSKNPLVTLSGKAKEIGTKKSDVSEVLGTTTYEYENEVDFVQLIKLKSPVKTNITGSITFQVCDEHQCYFPDPLPFSISL